jgi:hypothetical protein
MQKKIYALFVMTAIITCFFYRIAYADPWYTGPLLAPAGKTVPLGHFNFELYSFDTKLVGEYNAKGKKIRIPTFQTTLYNALFSYGLADKVDTEISVPYAINKSLGKRAEHIGDTTVILGYQALKQKPKSWIPNLRVVLAEVFPTGRFDNLNPTDLGTGVTGAGSYQTLFGLRFQDLSQLSETHYLRTRLALSYLHADPVTTLGKNGFGGNFSSRGHIRPGDSIAIDLAGEFTVSQNWVAVMEVYYLHHSGAQFTGRDASLRPLFIHHPAFFTTSIAPAIEYNFSKHFGIIGGVWLTLQGKNSPAFSSAVIAFNTYW